MMLLRGDYPNFPTLVPSSFITRHLDPGVVSSKRIRRAAFQEKEIAKGRLRGDPHTFLALAKNMSYYFLSLGLS